jgi:mRNA-degrading endonuclease RelE of RelBE toxin-antitoxin system
VRIEWSPTARVSARRYMADQDGMRAIGSAVAALAEDPLPAEGFHAGGYHRLRVGSYRVVYVAEGDLTTVSRVDPLTWMTVRCLCSKPEAEAAGRPMVRHRLVQRHPPAQRPELPQPAEFEATTSKETIKKVA